MKYMLCTVAALLSIGAVRADKNGRFDAEAEAAIAMAKAKSPYNRAITTHVSYADAWKVARATGKPVLVMVNMDCRTLCGSIRPAVITCKEKKFDGSDKSRAILCVPDREGNLLNIKEWPSLPTERDVKKTADDARKSYGDGASDDSAMLSALMLGTISISPFDAECPNGNCPINRPLVTTSGPIGQVSAGPVVYQWTEAPDVLPGEFVAAHPRLAALRMRFRSVLRLPSPRVAGHFIQLPAYRPAEEVQSEVAKSKVVGQGAAGDDELSGAMQTDTGVKFRAKLKEYRLGERFQLLYAARAIKAAEPTKPWVEVLKQLLDLMIEYGPKIINMLKLFGIL